MNTLSLENINFSLLKTNLELFLLNNNPDIKFIIMSATRNILLRLIGFLEVMFKITFPSSNNLKVDEFFMYNYSSFTSL
jgi:hypothetical protein